jgi:hypothetical protein
MKNKPLKYLEILLTKKHEIKNIYKDNKIAEHIDNLYYLIDYQMRIISEQRSIIVAEKHKEAWKQYCKSMDEYDIKSRKFFTDSELKARKC